MKEWSDFETLHIEIDKAVATVALNRPAKANAMNMPMWVELEECFRQFDQSPEVRAIVLAARGKHFCAGIDLSVFEDLTSATGSDVARRAEQVRLQVLGLQANLSAIEQCRKPVLAAIHSSCIGGGVDMVCCADMRFCTEQAHFSIKEIDIGMTADVGTLQRLPTLIAPGVVRELAYTGRRFNAQEAQRLGFVNAVYADQAALLQGVYEIASEIAKKSPLAIRGTKEMLNYARDHSVSDALNYVATWNAGMMSCEDVTRSITAQVDGSTPEYRG